METSEQKQAAMESMVEWLSDEHELGRAPGKIEYAGGFDLYEMHYYMFKYKKSFLSRKWLLGVCGGYEGKDMEHCGHVYSEMEEYDPETAVDKAAAMVEMIREYWKRRAMEASDQGGDTSDAPGPFAGFVLLNSCEWNPAQLQEDLKEDWDITVSDPEEGDQSMVCEVDDMLVAVSLMPAAVPDREAEQNAATNQMWPEAVEVTKGHVAHILVAVLNHGKSAVDAGQLYVKICASCLKQSNAIGINAAGTVFEPEFYLESAEVMHDDELPLLNLVYFGVYGTDNGLNGYTYGLRAFGKDEMEVLDCGQEADEVRAFLFDIAYYVVSEEVILVDGETIGFSEEEKLTITRSEGVSIDGDTLKIGFK